MEAIPKDGEGSTMFDRSSVSLVPEVVILAGVVLLVTSVFHTVLIWLAAIALALGILLLFGACLQPRFWSNSSAGFGAPPPPNATKEG